MFLTSSFTIPVMSEKQVNSHQKHGHVEDKKSFFILVRSQFLQKNKLWQLILAGELLVTLQYMNINISNSMDTCMYMCVNVIWKSKTLFKCLYPQYLQPCNISVSLSLRYDMGWSSRIYWQINIFYMMMIITYNKVLH